MTSTMSAPPQSGRHVGENRLYDMGVVGDAELIGDRQQQSVGFGDRLVRSQLLNERVRLGGIATAEDGPRLLVDKADLILFLAAASEIGAIAIIHQREDAAADRDARFARMSRLFPRGAKGSNL